MDCCDCIYNRNTSAYAEKTHGRAAPGPASRKHLRLRGENRMAAIRNRQFWETPPLTRRKLFSLAALLGKLRNTSAYAEKTQTSYRHVQYPEKHLRLRGENIRILPWL